MKPNLFKAVGDQTAIRVFWDLIDYVECRTVPGYGGVEDFADALEDIGLTEDETREILASYGYELQEEE